MTKLTITDIRAIRRILRYIATSDPVVQNETLRLDALLAQVITEHTTPKKEAS